MRKEKKQKKESEKSPKKKIKPQKDKQLYWVLGVMAGLIAIFFIASVIFQSLRTFEYQGMIFTKEMFGEIPLYRYTYGSITTGRATGISEVNLLLRNDPRENNVPIEGEIEFKRGKFVYIGINSTGIVGCDYSIIGIASLSSFISQNGFTIRSGAVDEKEAEENNLKKITCEDHPNNPVIILRGGEETSIVKEGENCYMININNCEVLEAIEKFEVQTILDAKARQLVNV